MLLIINLFEDINAIFGIQESNILYIVQSTAKVKSVQEKNLPNGNLAVPIQSIQLLQTYYFRNSWDLFPTNYFSLPTVVRIIAFLKKITNLLGRLHYLYFYDILPSVRNECLLKNKVLKDV